MFSHTEHNDLHKIFMFTWLDDILIAIITLVWYRDLFVTVVSFFFWLRFVFFEFDIVCDEISWTNWNE